MLVAYVPEKLAKRFYSDPDFILEAKCPYGKVESEFEHGDDLSSFDIEEELLQNVIYPRVGICQRCGKTVLVGYKPLRTEK